MNVALMSLTNVVSRKHPRAEATLEHQLLVVLSRNVSDEQLLVLEHHPAGLALMMFKVLAQMIPQRLHALIALLARPTLHDKVLPMVAHVKPQVVLAAEDFPAVVAGENLRYVPRLHVNVELVLVRQDLVTNRTFVRRDLLEMHRIVLVELLLRFVADTVAFAFPVTALKLFVSGILIVLVRLQLDDETSVLIVDSISSFLLFDFTFRLLYLGLEMMPLLGYLFRLFTLLNLNVFILLELVRLRDVLYQVVYDGLNVIVVKVDDFYGQIRHFVFFSRTM